MAVGGGSFASATVNTEIVMPTATPSSTDPTAAFAEILGSSLVTADAAPSARPLENLPTSPSTDKSPVPIVSFGIGAKPTKLHSALSSSAIATSDAPALNSAAVPGVTNNFALLPVALPISLHAEPIAAETPTSPDAAGAMPQTPEDSAQPLISSAAPAVVVSQSPFISSANPPTETLTSLFDTRPRQADVGSARFARTPSDAAAIPKTDGAQSLQGETAVASSTASNATSTADPSREPYFYATTSTNAVAQPVVATTDASGTALPVAPESGARPQVRMTTGDLSNPTSPESSPLSASLSESSSESSATPDVTKQFAPRAVAQPATPPAAPSEAGRADITAGSVTRTPVTTAASLPAVPDTLVDTRYPIAAQSSVVPRSPLTEGTWSSAGAPAASPKFAATTLPTLTTAADVATSNSVSPKLAASVQSNRDPLQQSPQYPVPPSALDPAATRPLPLDSIAPMSSNASNKTLGSLQPSPAGPLVSAVDGMHVSTKENGDGQASSAYEQKIPSRSGDTSVVASATGDLPNAAAAPIFPAAVRAEANSHFSGPIISGASQTNSPSASATFTNGQEIATHDTASDRNFVTSTTAFVSTAAGQRSAPYSGNLADQGTSSTTTPGSAVPEHGSSTQHFTDGVATPLTPQVLEGPAQSQASGHISGTISSKASSEIVRTPISITDSAATEIDNAAESHEPETAGVSMADDDSFPYAQYIEIPAPLTSADSAPLTAPPSPGAMTENDAPASTRTSRSETDPASATSASLLPSVGPSDSGTTAQTTSSMVTPLSGEQANFSTAANSTEVRSDAPNDGAANVVLVRNSAENVQLSAALRAWNGGDNAQTRLVQSANLGGNIHESELNVALREGALGAVELHARVSGDVVGASIGVERHDAHAAIASELPALHQALHERQLRVGDVSVFQGPINSGGAAADGRASQHRESASQRPQTAESAGTQGSALPEISAFSESSDAGNVFDTNGRLSVRA